MLRLSRPAAGPVAGSFDDCKITGSALPKFHTMTQKRLNFPIIQVVVQPGRGLCSQFPTHMQDYVRS